MFLTISTTHQPATDLGFLLHKHPDRAQSVPVSAGTAHVFYPQATETECTAALLVEVDPVKLVRGRQEGGLAQYVNDRPYAAGSQLAVALRAAFTTALTGRCAQRPELAAMPIPLSVRVPSLPSSGGVDLVERLFAPLGWQVTAKPVALDPRLDWGESRYLDVELRATLRLADALTQLYVLLPVLDGGKHYWVSDDEVDKLLRAGEAWLTGHPERTLITRRYLAHSRPLVGAALSRLAEADSVEPEALDDALADPVVTEAPDQPESLAVQRQGSVLAALRASGARRVLDLGCGSGALLRVLLTEPSFTEIVGVDVSARALEFAARKLRLEQNDRRRARVSLRQSALTYVDPSLAGYDAAVLMEVIEHIDESRLGALEHAVFRAAKPGTVIVTTPNAEYNVRFESLPAGRFRHSDHRFEWNRARFSEWAHNTAEAHGYDVRLLPVGDVDPEVGSPTQLAVFTRKEGKA